MVDVDAGSAEIHAAAGESITCTATNASTSTLPATGENPPPAGPGGGLLPNTGAPGLLWWLLAGLLLLVIGGVEAGYMRVRSKREWS